MYELITNDTEGTAPEVTQSLDELDREGARRMIAQALQFELEDRYPRMVKSLSKIDLFIFDDWLRDKPTLAETQSLLDILDDRYGRSSTLLATQFPVATWHSRIPDATIADAILDRLIHNAHRIELSGDSQRKIRAERIKSST